MTTVLYIHGFLSSPLSAKAEITRQWLMSNHADIQFHCPHIPPYPSETKRILEDWIEGQKLWPVYLMGSSLGGFWATWLAEKYDMPAVLINPAVSPQKFMPEYIGIDLKSYHTDDSYHLLPYHIDEIVELDIPVTRFNNYWLMVQKGDETLDYRDAVKKYARCKQTIEEGGDHSFQGFDNYLPEIINWFEKFK